MIRKQITIIGGKNMGYGNTYIKLKKSIFQLQIEIKIISFFNKDQNNLFYLLHPSILAL